jgi:acetamidase/formamidase
MARHELKAGPETVVYGRFDARTKPVLTLASGDTVVIETVSGGAEDMPREAFEVPAALRAIHAADLPQVGPHILTGPVAIEGAMPGDVLETVNGEKGVHGALKKGLLFFKKVPA